MTSRSIIRSAIFVLIASLAAVAQYMPAPNMGVQVPHVGKNTGNVAHRTTAPKQEPCWQVAGVSKSAIDRRNAVQRSANQQVESVCANGSLTPQQRSEEIRQIRQQERTEVSTIITPQQQEAIRECNQARRPATAVATPHPGSGVHRGPCGEILGSTQPGMPPLPGAGTHHPGSTQPTPQPDAKAEEPLEPQP